ncbi:hypothetical protein M2169_006093 [Streptomyces sp. MJP52]|nr:hypothetical protein [Streptomyces sp. MJP52]
MALMGPKPSGIIHGGASDGSIHREGTGGNPRRASPRPGTSSGLIASFPAVGVPPRTQDTTGSQRSRAGAMARAASARFSAASCAVMSMQRARLREESRALDALARNAVRSRSMCSASRVSCRSVSSTSHHATMPSSRVLACASKRRVPIAPDAGMREGVLRGPARRTA